MPNPCQDETLLSAFIDGELSQAEVQSVTRHLESCSACRKKLSELSAADGLIQGLAPIVPSAGFDRTFWGKVADLEEGQQSHWWKRFLRPAWRPALATGLAAGLVAGLFFITGLDKGVSPEDQFVAENVEFLNDYDLIRDLEILQNWEVLEAMKELS